MSLPVKMFEPKSTLQRVVDSFSYAPMFLKQHATNPDSLERFKAVIPFAMAGLHLCSGQLKPFNPILGETLQCHFKDGS